MINKLLVATDGSAHAGRAIDFAIDQALQYQAHLYIVNVFTTKKVSETLRHMAEVEHIIDSDRSPSAPATNTFPSTLMTALGSKDRNSRDVVSKIGDYLVDKAAKKARTLGVKKISTLVEMGNPVKVVLDIAQRENIDVIVTGSRGLGRVKGFLLGTVSYKINKKAKITCITVR